MDQLTDAVMSGPLMLGSFVFTVAGIVHVVRALIALPDVQHERRRRAEWKYQHSVVDFVRPNGSNHLRPIVEYARPDAIASRAAHIQPHIRQIIPDYAPTHMLKGQDLLVLVNPNDPYQVAIPQNVSLTKRFLQAMWCWLVACVLLFLAHRGRRGCSR